MVSTKVIGIFAAGVLLSPFLMPVILALIPVLIGLGCLLGAGIAYLVMAKGCRYRDFRFVAKGIWLKILIRLRGDKMVVPATFAKTMAEVGEHAPMITFVDDDKVYTYGDVDALSNQIARAMLAEKLGVGETVSLYMGNRPEYIATWLGVSKMGGRTALLNNNLRTKALLHGLKESQSKILIFDAASIDVIEESFEDIEAMGLKLFCYDEECDFAPCLVETMSELASSALPVEQTAAAKGVTVKDPVLYIFTSGTTGLPKAAVVTHFRYLYASLAFTLMFNYTKNDRVYTTMPLYHSAAGIIGVGSLIQTGCSMVLRSKFSKSQFVRDVRKYNCTIMQYIGELCRYLLAAPVTNYDSDTSLRLAIGNGLRPDIWDEFKTRFGIKQIGEFYAATEGAAALINTEDKKGSIGFLSPIIQLIQPQGCIEFSVEEEKPIRGADGLAKFCKPNQEGEFVAMIKVEKNGTSNFSGYTNKEASNKKIMTDVKTKGDRWFRSGDLLRIDEEGFVYFVDRIGDTFRWKGENVSTNEVAEIVAGYGFHEINVYGVKTPAGDGRAGMMSIVGVDPGTVDFEALAAYVSANLAKYARPIFIRFQEAMEVTGTFKHKKVELRNQGYDPNKCGGDPLFFYNGKSYEPLTEQLFADIEAGNVNL